AGPRASGRALAEEQHREHHADHGGQRDHREHQVRRPAPQRLEQHQLAARAEEAGDQADQDRARIPLDAPAGERERARGARDHRQRPDDVAERRGEAALLGGFDERAPDAPAKRRDERVDEPELAHARRMIRCDRMLRRLAVLLPLALLAPPAAAQDARVSVTTLELPTDEEGPPDPNPPFDLFRTTRYSYPYAIRDSLTGRQSVVRYRALQLENEYLRCVVLPDLGGHLYNCLDKKSGADLFYANKSLRKAQIGYRGAWVAFGVEFNFPVSHNWVSLSPVDYATRQNADGSASVFVGNVDRVYGMQWRVELRLRPGSSALEQHVALYNPSPVRRRFYWWNNAA